MVRGLALPFAARLLRERGRLLQGSGLGRAAINPAKSVQVKLTAKAAATATIPKSPSGDWWPMMILFAVQFVEGHRP
jgi:hypothetical protein